MRALLTIIAISLFATATEASEWSLYAMAQRGFRDDAGRAGLGLDAAGAFRPVVVRGVGEVGGGVVNDPGLDYRLEATSGIGPKEGKGPLLYGGVGRRRWSAESQLDTAEEFLYLPVGVRLIASLGGNAGILLDGGARFKVAGGPVTPYAEAGLRAGSKLFSLFYEQVGHAGSRLDIIGMRFGVWMQ